jgi:hypothetical protein
MAKTYRCKYCTRLFPSLQGQRSHLAQAKKCHERWQGDLDTGHILPQGLFEGRSNDNNQIAGILGEHPATYSEPSVDWNVDKPNCPEPPADEPLGLEEHEGDEDNSESTPPSKARWREYFPRQAGQGLRRGPTTFESLHNAQVARGESIWGKFSDEGDWEFAQWIVESGTTHTSTNELLELKKVSKRFIVKCMTYQSVADSACQLHLIPQ